MIKAKSKDKGMVVAVMMRRSFFDIVGLFDESLYACEDYDLWLRTSCKFPVYLIDTPLIMKRGGHEDQQSRTILSRVQPVRRARPERVPEPGA